MLRAKVQILGLIAIAALAVTLAQCSGSGGTASTMAPTPTPTPSPMPSGLVIPAGGGTLTLFTAAQASGYAGTLTVPAATTGGSALTVTTSTTLPAGLPTVLSRGRRPLQVTDTPVFYFSLTLSSTMSWPTTPSFTITLPSAAQSGVSYYFAFYDPTKASLGFQLTAVGPATVSGSTLTFPATSNAVTLTGGVTYWFALYYTTGASPTPTPSPSPTPTSASAGTTNTIAGNPGTAGSSNGTGTNALFRTPAGIAFDPSNAALYVADTGNCMARQVTFAGAVTTIAGNTSICGIAGIFPTGIAYDPTDNNLYVTNPVQCNVDQITMSGTITSIAGNSQQSDTPCSFGDGSGTGAHFNAPAGIAYDSATADLYVTDSGNCAIRQVTTAGAVTTIAGNPGTCGQSPTFSDGSGTSALFNHPEGIAYDPSNGALYVTDSKNCAIRQVTTAGAVTTIAGNPGTCGFSNGSGTSALFNVPEGLTYDSSNGNLYVVDSGNCAIRQVTLAGAVTTIAGNHLTCGQPPTWADGSGTSALFFSPSFITYDSANDELYVTDTFNDVIRQIKP